MPQKNSIKQMCFNKLSYLSLLLALIGILGATSSEVLLAEEAHSLPCDWSCSLGIQGSVSMLKTPADYNGFSAGFHGDLGYQPQKGWSAQLRASYDRAQLFSFKQLIVSSISQSYLEGLVGYNFSVTRGLHITPHLGLGVDWLKDSQDSYGDFWRVIDYKTYYGILGLVAYYQCFGGSMGLEVDAFFPLSQEATLKGFSIGAQRAQKKMSLQVRLPMIYKFLDSVGLEVTPYCRLMEMGACEALELPAREYADYGLAVVMRFFL